MYYIDVRTSCLNESLKFWGLFVTNIGSVCLSVCHYVSMAVRQSVCVWKTKKFRKQYEGL